LIVVAESDFGVDPGNPCLKQKDRCLNCHNHFMAVRPHITSVVVTKRFFKDMKDIEKAKELVRDVLDCANTDFNELHKFEQHVAGCMIFRAKKKGMHIVYCVDKNMRIIFMRVFKNLQQYEKFLDDKKEIRNIIQHT